MDANSILRLLAEKHADDVFVPECKNGPSQGCSHLRTDAWAMARSWSSPCVRGYEIKVSRQDFLSDKKWPQYLPYCNEFFFVAPKGIIDPQELPAEVGLLVPSANGVRLFTKKQAAYRELVIPESLYRYLLICRASICDEAILSNSVEYWKNWLARRAEDKHLGYRVAQAVREHVDGIERENNRLRTENAALQVFKLRLLELGVDAQKSVSLWHVERAIEKLRGSIPAALPREVASCIARLTELQNTLKEVV